MGPIFRRIASLAKGLRGSSSEFYALADLATAKRLGGVLWVLGVTVVVLLLPISPPTASPLGNWGWAVTAWGVGVSVLLGRRLLRQSVDVSPNELLGTSYAALFLVALLVWLAGSDSPYQEVFLYPVLFTAAVHPPRRVLVYLVALIALTAAPLAYDGWDGTLADQTAGRLVIWGALGLVAMAFTDRVRSQRLGLARERREATEQARSDALTGLGNRRAFDEALGAAFERVGRSGEPLSVIVADLDGFKEINDRWGHLVGDECLRDVGEVLRTVARAPEACFRWGGDEFAILADADLEGADVLRGRVAEAVADGCSTPDGGRVSVRLGAAQLEPGMTAQELVARADLDLLAAKSEAQTRRRSPASQPGTEAPSRP